MDPTISRGLSERFAELLEESEEETENKECQPQSDKDKDRVAGVISYRDIQYKSKEMKRFLQLNEPEEIPQTNYNNESAYKPINVFPEWVLGNPDWKLISKVSESGNAISEILNTPVVKRTQDQISTLIHWLMSVWKIANTMGFKRCGAMFKEFKYATFEPGEDIITEGDRGLIFYIIISGNTTVRKNGIGIVGNLGKGKSFGEIALTQGKDLRTATVRAETFVEVLTLHKLDYEYFVRDIQEVEKRENFNVLAECKLFQTWPKGKIEKMSNNCLRRTCEPGEYVFHQGDNPEDIFVIIEGNIEIVKELIIICKNRWPSSVHTWDERKKRVNRPINLKNLGRGDAFGEYAILKKVKRTASAIATTRTILVSLDKLEFLHLLKYGNSNIEATIYEEERLQAEKINRYISDQDVLESVNFFKGGPDSIAVIGDRSVKKRDLLASTKSGLSTTRSLENLRKMNEAKKKEELRLATLNGEPALAQQVQTAKKSRDAVDQLYKGSLEMGKKEKLRKEKEEAFQLEMQRKIHPSVAITNQINSNQTIVSNITSGNSVSAGFSAAAAIKKAQLIASQVNMDSSGKPQFTKMSFIRRRTNHSNRMTSRHGSMLAAQVDPSFEDNRIVLRKNSVIHVGQVINQVNKKIAAAEDALLEEEELSENELFNSPEVRPNSRNRRKSSAIIKDLRKTLRHTFKSDFLSPEQHNPVLMHARLKNLAASSMEHSLEGSIDEDDWEDEETNSRGLRPSISAPSLRPYTSTGARRSSSGKNKNSQRPSSSSSTHHLPSAFAAGRNKPHLLNHQVKTRIFGDYVGHEQESHDGQSVSDNMSSTVSPPRPFTTGGQIHRQMSYSALATNGEGTNRRKSIHSADPRSRQIISKAKMSYRDVMDVSRVI